MQYDLCHSPLGELTICSDGTSIVGLHIEGDRYFLSIPSDWRHSPNSPLLRQARKELAEYFAGTRAIFDLPVRLSGTAFQKQVWAVLERIPKGSTLTYGAVAELVGRPKAVRAVGTAVGRNPICIIVPCHRVLASDGGLGGYVAGPARKQKLLELENVLIERRDLDKHPVIADDQT